MIVETRKCYCVEVMLTFISICFYFLALGPINAWWLLWIAPLPLLIYSLYGNKWITFLLVFLSNITGGLLAIIAYYTGTMMPILAFVPILLFSALVISGITVLNSIVITNWKHWLTVLFYPVVIVVFNFLMVLLAKGSLIPVDYAFTQYHFLTLIQLVSFTGIWGICFLLNMLPNALAVIWFYRHARCVYFPIIIFVCAFLSATIIFGSYKLLPQSQTATINVGIAAHKYLEPMHVNFQMQINFDTKNSKVAVEAYIKNIEVLAKQGAEYILQPEYSIFLPSNDQVKHDAIAAISKAAQQNKVTVLFAFGEYDLIKHVIKQNHVVIISPQGKVIADYHKQHLVAFSESAIKPQNLLVQFLSGSNKLGVAICHDMDNINPAKEYGKAGIGLLFVPAADFGVTHDAWWHARMAIVQSIANGYALARVGAYGYLTVSDSNGRIIAVKTTSQDAPVYLTGTVLLGSGNTFYARYGNWFAWLNVIMLGVLLGYLCREFYKHK